MALTNQDPIGYGNSAFPQANLFASVYKKLTPNGRLTLQQCRDLRLVFPLYAVLTIGDGTFLSRTSEQVEQHEESPGLIS